MRVVKTWKVGELTFTLSEAETAEVAEAARTRPWNYDDAPDWLDRQKFLQLPWYRLDCTPRQPSGDVTWLAVDGATRVAYSVFGEFVSEIFAPYDGTVLALAEQVVRDNTEN